jgi:Kef-type K+ transport system membrane component KefB
MNQVEAIIVLLLLFMAVPDVCRKLQRPALMYSAYVIFGAVLGPWLVDDVGTMLRQAGHVGFYLLLFEVGMEIDLPKVTRLIRPIRNAVLLALLQIPLVLGIAHVAGFDISYALLGAAALTGCSVGMAHAAWKAYPGLSDLVRKRILRTMVALELWSILALVVGSAFLKGEWDTTFGVTLLAIAAALFLIAQYGSKLVPVFEWIITRTTHWRVHLLVLLILVVCTIGERVGLGGPKTAFFLGLAMSQTRHRGMNLDEHMAPISQRFLIPIFFVALGLQIRWLDIVSLTGVLAFGTAGVLLAVRMVVHNRMLKIGGDKHAFLLLSPNLTMVALGATALLQHPQTEQIATWLLLAGLFMTIPSILLLPAAIGETTSASQREAKAATRPTAQPTQPPARTPSDEQPRQSVNSPTGASLAQLPATD